MSSIQIAIALLIHLVPPPPPFFHFVKRVKPLAASMFNSTASAATNELEKFPTSEPKTYDQTLGYQGSRIFPGSPRQSFGLLTLFDI